MSSLFRKDASLNDAPARSGPLRRCLYPGGAVLAFALANAAPAQDAGDSARRFTLDVSQGLEWSNNPDLAVIGESELLSRTSLTFGLERRTSIDRLALSLGGDFILSDEGDSGFENPAFRLDLGRDVGHSRIGLDVEIRETQLDSGDFIFDEDTGSVDFITDDNATRRSSRIGLSGAFGVEAPFGGSYRLSREEIRYSDTTDTALVDADRTVFDGRLDFRLDPRIVLGLIASHTEVDEIGPGAIDTTSSRLGTSLDMEITQRLTGRFALGWQRVEERGLIDTTEDGAFLNAGLTWAMPNGSVGMDADSVIDVNGRRNTVQVRRSMELPRGALSYSVGLSQASGLDANPIFGLAWRQDLPRAVFSVALTQTPATTRENVEAIYSALTLGYVQQLTTRSSFDTSLSVRDSDELTVGGIDSRRFDLDMTYRHELAQDWNMVGRVSVARIEEDGVADRSSNTVFIGLEKRFVWN